MRAPVRWLDPDRLARRSLGVPRPPEREQRIACVHVGRCRLRRECDLAIELDQRPFHLAVTQVKYAEVVMRRWIVRVGVHRFPAVCDRLPKVAGVQGLQRRTILASCTRRHAMG